MWFRLLPSKVSIQTKSDPQTLKEMKMAAYDSRIEGLAPLHLKNGDVTFDTSDGISPLLAS